ncbi:MAG: hypothetical protein N3G77_08005, partial [Nitrososphaeria archaeon]|nr:hypothetical protein [Nitrososphaeria archaeon]
MKASKHLTINIDRLLLNLIERIESRPHRLDYPRLGRPMNLIERIERLNFPVRGYENLDVLNLIERIE